MKFTRYQSRIAKFVFFTFLVISALGNHHAQAYQNAPTESVTPEISTTPTVSVTPGTESNLTLTPSPTLGTVRPSQSPPENPTETAISIATETPTPSPSFSGAKKSSGDLPKLQEPYAHDQIIAKFKTHLDQETIDQCILEISATIDSKIDELNAFTLNIPKGQVAESIANIHECKGLIYAEPNYIAHMIDTVPDDPGWPNQYGLGAIKAPIGWDISTGSSAITIAIVDTGVDLTHSDFAGKIVPGYDFVNNDNTPQDDNGHGTHVAGIAAAIGNNHTGIAGVSWGARIMPVKVLNAGGSGSFDNVAKGIIWATDNNAQIINLSLGGPNPSLTLEDAVNYAYNNGVTIVAATGNTGSNLILYPARYPHVIAVSATDSLNHWAGFSNYGTGVDIAAPGVSIYSTWIGNGYSYDSGTSMSTAFVSGVASILRSSPSYASPDWIASVIENTALDIDPPGNDIYTGAGLIQMDAALILGMGVPATNTSSPLLSKDQWNLSPILLPSVTFTSTSTTVPSSTQSATSTVATPIPLFTILPSNTPATPTIPGEITIQGQNKTKFPTIAKTGFCLIGIGIVFLIIFLVWRKHERRRTFLR